MTWKITCSVGIFLIFTYSFVNLSSNKDVFLNNLLWVIHKGIARKNILRRLRFLLSGISYWEFFFVERKTNCVIAKNEWIPKSYWEMLNNKKSAFFRTGPKLMRKSNFVFLKGCLSTMTISYFQIKKSRPVWSNPEKDQIYELVDII